MTRTGTLSEAKPTEAKNGMSTAERIRRELQVLIQEGTTILADEVEIAQKKKKNGDTEKWPAAATYQDWYTRALPVVRELLPDRYAEFQELYKIERRKNENIDFLTYTISDYLIGLRVTRGYKDVVDTLGAFTAKFQHQILITRSALVRLDSVLADIRGVLQAEFFDDELSVAAELLKKKHLRAAGAVSGVTLERHLKQTASTHQVPIRKQNPGIAEFNDALKTAGIFQLPTWRFVQRLADIRNLCVHSKHQDPTHEEVEELIQGTEKAVKSFL